MNLKIAPLYDCINMNHTIDYQELKDKLDEIHNIPKKYSTEIIDFIPYKNNILRFILNKKMECGFLNEEDFIGECFLRITLPKLKKNQRWKKNIGDRIVKNIEFNIGGSPIENLDTEFHYLSKWLKRDEQKDELYNKLIGNIDELNKSWDEKDNYTIYLPINLFLTSYSLMMTSIVILHNYEIMLELNDIKDLIETKNNSQINDDIKFDIKLIKKFYYIIKNDKEPEKYETIRNKMADFNGIQLVQHVKSKKLTLNDNILLNFINLECKYFYFYILPKNQSLFDSEPLDILDSIELYFNKYLRLNTRSEELKIYNFYQLFKRIPKNMYLVNFIEDLNTFTSYDCSNFNKFDNIILKIKFNENKIKKLIYHKNNLVLHCLNKKLCNDLVKNIFDFIKFDEHYVINQFDIKIHGVSNNFLRIKSGLSGLMFSN